MNRLIDEAGEDATLHEAARLVRDVVPADASGIAKARVWSKLRRERVAARGSRLRPVLAMGLVLLLGAFASAAALKAWRYVKKPAVAPSEDVRERARHQRTPAREPVEAVAPVEVAPTVTAPIAIEPPQPAELPKTSEHTHNTHVTHAQAPEAPSVKPSDDPAPMLLQRATRALHNDHDLTRAASLADDYLSLYPDGDLIEEAFAIAIQAHAGRHDDRAAALAERYLARFPNGRFRAEALLAQ